MLVMSKLMFPSEKVAEKEFEFQKIVRIDEKRDMYLPSWCGKCLEHWKIVMINTLFFHFIIDSVFSIQVILFINI